MIMEFKLIRGKRLLQQLIQEASYAELDSNSRTRLKTLTGRENDAVKTRVINLQLVPAVPSSVLKIESTIQGETNRYNCVMQFDNIVYDKEATNTNVEFIGPDSKTYFMQPIKLATNNVRVFCSCLDFRWRFAFANSKNNSLYGNVPPPYAKKTDRQPVNPQNVPGVCKHLIKLAETLSESGVVV